MNSTFKRRFLIIPGSIVIGVICITILPRFWFSAYLKNDYHIPDPPLVQAKKVDRLCLIFALDGVPFDLMDELHKEGFFKGFYKPGRLVSTFPSLTRPAFSRMLIGGKPFGYERLYFDSSENRIKGFTLLKKIFSSAKKYPDYHPRLHFLGFPGYIAYVFPDRFTQTAMDGFKKRVVEFKGTEFIAYMGISDAISHVRGREALKNFLKRISRLLDETRNESGVQMDMVVFSDHGNNFVPNQWVDLVTPLAKAGFTDSKHLETQKDFVLIQNGFVSSAAIYCSDETAPSIAETLSHVNGVDFSVFKAGNSVIVHGKNARAQIRKQEDRFRYIPITGDPLGLFPIMNDLNKTGKADTNGFIHENDLWEATRDHIYPDPLRRIWDGLHNLVQYPSTILVSFKDGYAFGPDIFNRQLIAGRESTHGALLASHSNGFFMTDFKPVKPYNRPKTVADLLKKTAELKGNGFKSSGLKNE